MSKRPEDWPFSPKETETLLEAARVALANLYIADAIQGRMSLSADSMVDLTDRLSKYLGGEPAYYIR